MIYLTNDMFDHAVYFDLRKREPQRKGSGVDERFYGLLGNGICELPVSIRSWRDCVEMAFGRGELFNFVEERTIRRMLGEVVREMALH